MRLIVYEVCFTLASSAQQYFSFIYFSAVFLGTQIFECAKVTRWSHTKFCHFAVVEANQMPLGVFYVYMNR